MSALEERGVVELWSVVESSVADAKAHGAFEARRKRDRLAWFREELERTLRERWLGVPGVGEKLAELERLVQAGSLAPTSAARALVDYKP